MLAAPFSLPPPPPVRPRAPFKAMRQPIPVDLLQTTLRLATLWRTVLPKTAHLARTPMPTTRDELTSMVANFHEEVRTLLFPHNPDTLRSYARDAFDPLEMTLTIIAPEPVGSSCFHCEPPAPGDPVHLFHTLDSLSRPHPLELPHLTNLWQTHYPDWDLPEGFYLETVCLHLEDNPVPAPYTALPDVIRHALGYTGNWFLDACPHCWYEESEAWYWPEGTDDLADVQTLTRLWHEAHPRWQEIGAFYEWFTDDPLRRREQLFALLVNTHQAQIAATPALPVLPPQG